MGKSGGNRLLGRERCKRTDIDLISILEKKDWRDTKWINVN
jgi:hypothetical protein